MAAWRHLIPFSGLLMLGACAQTIPVVAEPGAGKTAATFQHDEIDCRVAASRAAYATSPAPPEPTKVALTSPAFRWPAFFAAYGNCQQQHGNLLRPVPWVFAYSVFLGRQMPFAAAPPPYGYPSPYGYPPPFAYPPAQGYP